MSIEFLIAKLVLHAIIEGPAVVERLIKSARQSAELTPEQDLELSALRDVAFASDRWQPDDQLPGTGQQL